MGQKKFSHSHFQCDIFKIHSQLNFFVNEKSNSIQRNVKMRGSQMSGGCLYFQYSLR